MAFPRLFQKPLLLGLAAIALLLAAACGSDDPVDSSVTIVADDHGDTIASATSVKVPSTFMAQLGMTGDVDIFAVEMQAGVSYGFETSLGSLEDTVLTLLDPFDQEFSFSDNYGGLASRIEFTTTNTLTMYLKVEGAGTATGSYDLTVETYEPQQVGIHNIVNFPGIDDELAQPGLRGVAVFRGQPGAPIALAGTGFSSMLDGNTVWLGDQRLPVKTVGPGYVTFVLDGVVSPDPKQLTIETDFGLDSIQFTLEAPPGG
jgi:hypothetical protein